MAYECEARIWDRSSPDRRHRAAVRMSLDAADAAAHQGDYADALAWADMVLVVDGPLPAAYAEKHVAWTRLLADSRAARAAASRSARRSTPNGGNGPPPGGASSARLSPTVRREAIDGGGDA